jgi:hypothetical protein
VPQFPLAWSTTAASMPVPMFDLLPQPMRDAASVNPVTMLIKRFIASSLHISIRTLVGLRKPAAYTAAAF